MASTFSSRLRFELIGAGEQSGAWGNTTNSNIGTLIDEAIAGVAAITLSSTTHTLVQANGATDNARQPVLVFTGNPGGNATVTCPAAEKTYIIKNGLSGGYTLTIQTSAGGTPATVTIPNDSVAVLYTDGSDFFNAVKDLAANATVNGATITTNTGTQTLTNKTLTSPTINGGTITGITDLAIADGGTGASTAADARTNLGIGTIAVQDADDVSITGGSITGITDLAVADGGTGASTSSNARTNLDVNQAGTLSGINNQTSNYTLVLSDRGKLVEMQVNSANTVTIPLNGSVAFPVGTVINLISIGSGQTSISPYSGVTLYSYGTKRKLSGQYSMATLVKKDTDTWYLAGDLMG